MESVDDKKHKRKSKHKTKQQHKFKKPSVHSETKVSADAESPVTETSSKPSRKRHRNGHSIDTDQPDQSMITDQPDQSMTTAGPDQSMTTAGPDQSMITDQPDQSMTTDQPDQSMTTAGPDEPGVVPQIDQSGGDLRLGSAVSMMKRRDLPLDVVRHWEQVEDSYVDIHDTWRFGSVTGQWKKGRWTHEEVETLKRNVMAYMHNNGVEDISELIFDRSRKDRGKFFQLISKNINRPLFHVYRKMVRIFDEANYAGKWSSEQDSQLLRLYDIHGTKWTVIGKAMGLASAACRDRYRRMARKNTGPWTAAEEARLIDVMKEVCAKNNPSGPLPESGEEEEGALPATVSWHDIARSVRTRTAMQCRQKWVMSLSWKSKDSSQMWGVDDTIRLLETLGTTADVVSEDEVDWAGLCRKWPGNWTHYYLRERWGRLRRDVPNYRVKSFQDALDYLITHKLPALQELRDKAGAE